MTVDIVVNPPMPAADVVHDGNGDDVKGPHPISAVVTGSNGVKMHPKAGPSHPLGPLTAAEIGQASSAIRSAWPEGTLFQFKVITLSEPAKAQMVSYLDAEHKGLQPSAIDRRAFVVYYIKNTVGVQESNSSCCRPWLMIWPA
jgi:Cu2+-containing amine oxidase